MAVDSADADRLSSEDVDEPVGNMDVWFNLAVGSDPFDPSEHQIIETVDGGGIIPGTLT